MKTQTAVNWLRQVVDQINDPGISVDSYDLCPECRATYLSLESIGGELHDSDDPEQVIMMMYDNQLHCGGHYCEADTPEEKKLYIIDFSRVELVGNHFNEKKWTSRIHMTTIESFEFTMMIRRLCKWSHKSQEWVYDRYSFTTSIRIR